MWKRFYLFGQLAYYKAVNTPPLYYTVVNTSPLRANKSALDQKMLRVHPSADGEPNGVSFSPLLFCTVYLFKALNFLRMHTRPLYSL